MASGGGHERSGHGRWSWAVVMGGGHGRWSWAVIMGAVVKSSEHIFESQHQRGAGSSTAVSISQDLNS